MMRPPRLVLVLASAGLFTCAGEVKAQSDAFEGTVLDPVRWELTAPRGGSTVAQDGALFLTNEGTAGGFCNSPGMFGPGVGIGSRKQLAGDFDIRVDFIGFSGPSADYVQAFFNVYQDQDNQIHIKKIRGASLDAIQTVAVVGGVFGNIRLAAHSATSGTFRITRSGSLMTAYLDGSQFSSTVAFTGPVRVSLIFVGPSGATSSIAYDNFVIASGTLTAPSIEVDADQDSVEDVCDNCPTVANPAQTNADGDAYGAACDCGDDDASVYPGAPQVCDGVNNDCSDPAWPAVPGNEGDADGDQVPACSDNCPLTPNPGQENGGGSSCGDACDPTPLTVRFTPRTLNERAQGLYVKAHLRLGSLHTTASFDPNQPILLSVAGGAPIADLARQVTGDDLVVSFSRQDVAAAAPVGEAVEFRLSGGVTYGCVFEGVDQVRVIGEGNVHTNEEDWSSIVDDAPRGDLDSVRANGNGNLGDVTCLPDYQSNYDFSTNTDAGVPPPGKVFVYLFRFCNGTPNCSYGQTSSGQERTVGSGACL